MAAVVQDDDLFPAGCERDRRFTRLITEAAPLQWGVLAGRDSVGLDGLHEMFAKPGRFNLSLFLQQVAHFGREGFDETHAQVIANGVNVIVGGVIEEMDRGRQGGSVLAGKSGLRPRSKTSSMKRL